MIRVIVVDDHPQFRAELIQALTADGDISVVGEGESAAEAVELTARFKPDIVMLDVTMSDNGISRIPDVLSAYPPARVIVVTAATESQDQALNAGASGFVLKGATGAQMREIVRSFSE